MTLRQGMCNQIFKFAYVTEVFQAVKCDTESEKPYKEITKLKYWVKKCKIIYVSKYEVMEPKSYFKNDELESRS